jgi:hypothetical protein
MEHPRLIAQHFNRLNVLRKHLIDLETTLLKLALAFIILPFEHYAVLSESSLRFLEIIIDSRSLELSN